MKTIKENLTGAVTHYAVKALYINDESSGAQLVREMFPKASEHFNPAIPSGLSEREARELSIKN